MNMKNIYLNGFTLVELLVVMAIVAIFASIAVPSFTDLIINNRIVAQVNDIVGSINLARSEAVKRGSAVSICQSNDGATCGSGSDWASGWVVFSDPNVNGSIDAGEEIVHVFSALSGSSTAVFSGATSSITYLGVGKTTGAFTGTSAAVCPPIGGNYCRYVCINSLGRPRVDTPAQYAVDSTCGN
jgi:type IV fimbrial biogenesis protein FimT